MATSTRETDMTKNQIKSIINGAISELYPLRHLGNYDVLEEMFEYEKKQQLIMKNAAPYGIKPDPVALVSKYFVVKHLIDAVENPQHFRPRDILHCTKSYLLAHALVDAYPESVTAKVRQMCRHIDLSELDYTCGEIIQRETEEVTA